MNSILTRVYVSGFDPGDLKDWQERYGLEPVEVGFDAVSMLPEGVPVVVHTDRAAELANKLDAEGILRDVILYVPSGAQRPQHVSFDAVVHDADLSRLRELVTHAEQLRMARLAHDVPLNLLTRRAQDIDLQHLGLPQQDAAHLANCSICPDIFREALRERVRLYQRLSCPSPGELIEYASTGKISDARLVPHMQRCPLCGAQLEALRSAIAEQPTTIPAVNAIASIGIARRERAHPGKVLIEVPVTTRLGDTISSLGPKFDKDLDDLRNGLRAAFGTLFDLFDGARRGIEGWQIVGVRGFKDSELETEEPGTDAESQTLPILLEVYEEQSPAILSRGRQSLYLGWDGDAEEPYVELPQGISVAAREFSIEIRRLESDDLIWAATSSRGRLALPPELVERELRAYEARHQLPPSTGYKLAIVETNSETS